VKTTSSMRFPEPADGDSIAAKRNLVVVCEVGTVYVPELVLHERVLLGAASTVF
jgi:hypothetical protein